MKIKIAILDTDENYIGKFMSNFQIRYADKVDLYIFTGMDQLIKNLNSNHIDVILVDDSLRINDQMRQKNVVLIYLCKTMDVEEIEGIPTTCKFQRIENIYKQILGLYAENASDIKMKKNGSTARIVLFLSAQGGCGTSSAAAAYALRYAQNRKNVFYLNLELFSDSSLYFSDDSTASFSDVIYALKSKKNNLTIKLESSVKTDRSGVDYYDACKNAYDMLELQDEEIGELIRGISQMKEYEYIVIDMSGEINQRMLMLMNEYASRIVCVNDGSASGNRKFERFCEIVNVIEKRSQTQIMKKMLLLYNRYGTKSSTQLEQSPIQVAGGIHRYEGVSGRALIEEIAKMEVLDQI